MIDPNPVPTKEIAASFNDLRQDIMLLHELQQAFVNCEYELQTLRHRFETLAPGRVCDTCSHLLIMYSNMSGFVLILNSSN